MSADTKYMLDTTICLYIQRRIPHLRVENWV